MEAWLLTLVFFGSLIVGLFLGLPIAFVLAGIAIVFIALLWGGSGLLLVFSTAYGKGTDFVLVALPLFILMANFLEVSGIADGLYDAMYRWFAGVNGGLAMGTVIICAIFAAMAGISGVATVTMGLIGIPSMMKRGYDKELVTGTVAAGGALGILIPPSIIAIVYGAAASVSIGKLFMGGVMPGILLSILFIIYIAIRCKIQPKLGPASPTQFTWREKISSLKAVIFPLLLIILVLGSIYTGVATPTEAAGIGAFGSLIACALHRSLTWENLKRATLRTVRLSSMCMWIVFGAGCFSHIYIGSGASAFLSSLIVEATIPPMAIIWIMMFIYIILGMVLDPIGMCLITVPIFVPVVAMLGFSPLWFGVLFIVVSEMAFITPPFGFNLFYLKSIVPPSITVADIYRSITPFVFIQFLCLVIVLYLPQIALWLPSMMITVGR